MAEPFLKFKRMTSSASPLRIDVCRAKEYPDVPGLPFLGMTICPGKKDERWDRDMGTDTAAIKEWGAHLVVSLLENREFNELKVRNLGACVQKGGMAWWHWPVVDQSPLAPDFATNEADPWELHCATLRALMAMGLKVLVHCRGGIGRTGTLAARLLVEEGHTPADALHYVRTCRSGAVENADQEDYLNVISEILARNSHRAAIRSFLLKNGPLASCISFPRSEKLLKAVADVWAAIPSAASEARDAAMLLLPGVAKNIGHHR